jgi:hypothetical protein
MLEVLVMLVFLDVLTVILIAMAMALSLAHVAELPGKLRSIEKPTSRFSKYTILASQLEEVSGKAAE